MIKTSIRSFFAELVTIVVGILLALYANAQYETYKEKRKTRVMLSSIRTEIEANRTNIAELLPEQKALRDLLFAKANEKTSLVEAFDEANHQTDRRNAPEHFLATWRSAVSMGLVEHMDPELVRLLSRVDYLHQMQDRRLHRVMDLAYSSASFRREGSEELLRATSMVVGDYIYNQESLLDLYDKVLNLIPE